MLVSFSIQTDPNWAVLRAVCPVRASREHTT